MATINGDSGNNTLVDTSGDDTIDGKGGNDTITVTSGSDTVMGGTGTDTLIVNYASDTAGISNNGGPSIDSSTGGFDGAFSGSGRYVSYNSIEIFNITTGSGNDSITTASGADTVNTGAGNDFVDVGSGNDTANGGADTDGISADLSALTTAVAWNLQTNTFTGANHSFTNFEYFGTVSTGSGADTIVTGLGAHNETVNSGGGNDSITVAGGNDTVNAGAGTDTLVLNYAADTNGIANNGGPSADSSIGGFDGAFSGSGYYVSYNSIENFNITTGSGNDNITTATGADTVNTGTGDDNVDVGSGNDSADGGVGSDGISADLSTLTSAVAWNVQANTFTGANHSFTNFEYFGTVSTGSGADTIVSGTGGHNETINSGGGNDSITVAGGSDTVNAGTGTDTLVIDYSAATGDIYNNGGPSTDTSLGGFDGAFSGNQSVSYTSVEKFNITTGLGNDSIVTASGNDIVNTGAGNDTVDVGTGTDSADGGADVDGISADLSDATGAIVWNLQNNTFTGGPDSFTNFEYFGTITTGGGNDVITTAATGRTETVNTGLGNDIFTTVDGGDQFNAGKGSDTLIVDFSGATGDIYNNGGPGANGTDGGFDGGFSGNRSVGYSSVETFNITTGSGNDTITTATGNDIVNSGSGNDFIDTGSGTDYADGGAGNDGVNADLSEATQAVIWNLQTNSFSGGPDTFLNFEYFGTVTTGSGNDVITTAATGRAETVNTGLGNDIFTTVDGGDQFNAGKGSDTLIVDFSGATGDIYNNGGPGANSADGGFDGGFSGNRSVGYSSVETFNITTGNGNDTITTATGNDIVSTGSGNDFVDTGSGTDYADGGAGNDGVNADLSEATQAVIWNLQTNSFSGGPDTFLNFEYFGTVTTGSGNDVITTAATGRAETVNTGLGDDIFTTVDGGDQFNAGKGSDTLIVDFSGATGDIYNNGGPGANGTDGGFDGGFSGNRSVGYTSVETFNITTGSGNDTITTATGNDTIRTGSGNDTINSGDGNDLVATGVGTDTADGGTGTDRLVLDYSAATTAINSTGPTADTTEGGFDGKYAGGAAFSATYTSFEAFTITTGSGNDRIITASGDDIVSTGAGTDTISTGDGNDTLDGGTGADQMTGGNGNDIYYVDDAGDVVTETAAAGGGVDEVRTGLASYSLGANVENLTGTAGTGQTLTGNELANTITGGSGNDTLDGGAGADTLIGGQGNDTYKVDDAGDVVTENVGEGVDTVLTTLASYTLGANLENLTGTAGTGQTLTGNAVANTITGGSGNDILDGGAGADTLIGGQGGDLYYVDDAGDVVTENAGEGNDEVRTALAVYTLAANVETLTGTSGAGQILTGNALDNTISGGGGNDVIDGGAGADAMAGGAGDDSYVVDSAGDTVTEGANAGTDTVRTSLASYTLGANLENLVGTAGTGQTLTGNDLANLISGGGGNDIIDGRGGNDTVSYASAAAAVTVSLSVTKAQNTVGAGSDTLTSIENLLGSAYDDHLTGNAGANTLTGGAGNDTLEGGAGDDTLDGGDGSDTAAYARATAAVMVDLSIMAAQATGGGGTDTLISIENLTGSAYNDTLTGNGGDNVLAGGGGDDVLDGGAGSDTASYALDHAPVTVSLAVTGAQATGGAGSDMLVDIENLTGTKYGDTLTGNAGANVLTGGNGDDLLSGGAGDDVLDGGAGSDHAVYADAGSAVTVNLTLTGAQATGGAGMDTLIGIEAIDGSAFNDTLTGDTHGNRLNGGAGDDVLVGGGGADVFNGGTGFDTVDYSGVASGIRVDLSNTASQNTLVGPNTLIAIENLIGSAFNDTLTGNTVANVLTGGDGSDTLDGGLGKDVLTGGAGNDKFYFTTTLGKNNIDTITDFSVALDKIFLDHDVFAGLTAGALATGAFYTGTAAHDADDRIIYNAATGALLFDSDGTGSAAAVQFATLSTGLALSASRFTVT